MKKIKTNDFHKMVGYQIYPKSFKDTNGDGIGDINGIIEKIPYLRELGIDFIWINPIYKSPQVDGGYDISDYQVIDEMFGSLEDFKKLLDKAHENGLKVIMDLVVNHTSDQHPWFLESQKSKDNPYRDYYLWEDASPNQMPNDWISFFGGSTWAYDEKTKQAYFHVFAKEQPDLNWKNPKVRQEIYDMIRWWLDLGIDGFRLDAISHIQKMPWNYKIKSWKGDGPWVPFMNVAGIETYMSDLKAIFDEYGALTVGEASGVRSKQAPDWTDEAGYINMIFELEHNVRKSNGNGQGSIYGYKKVIMRWQEDLLERGWNALYIENHDQPRSIDTFGDGSIESAKALAVSYMLLRGTPFIYQGQEFGMTNFPFTDAKQLRADEIKKKYEMLMTELSANQALAEVTQNSREHSRTPMQWDNSKNAGFTSGQAWMEINPNFSVINSQTNQELIELYKKLIELRHQEPAISEGSIKFHFKRHPQVLVYERAEFLIIVNLADKKAHLDFTKIDSFTDSSAESSVINYQQVLGSSNQKFQEKMVLSAWEYRVYKK
ncbi:alpha-glucosidase [Lactococcus lactis]|uniref:Alpha-amylase n=2 Tax=Lactococcus lactis TaxID=1358 RepID=A0AAP4DU87_9LACT|nr:alpha-glucosidase [Lactococcus lactis]KST78191.1 Alpha-glucosidase [Lactococcus lactis subsp. lactis]KST85862.1 Alpha-glucosidase [Lactococcus lactis subsp. lactis]MCT0448836.1 alpha-glucosidase [Lactococcus lactis subsp. lactis]MCT3092233.1 alpha-glucosidase [Lactococcus lactis]MCW2280292.1 alpha-glucosidase [Lactococcus lactis]